MFNKNPQNHNLWQSHVQVLLPSCTIIDTWSSNVFKDALAI